MKTCLLCGTSAADHAATCANDGEASWSAPSADATPVDAPAQADDTPVDAPASSDVDAPTKPKRGRR